MSHRRPVEFLTDILDYAEAGIRFGIGHTRQSIEIDLVTLYAVEWVLTVVGEAGKRLPKEVRDRADDIPWKLMARMRDRLVHGYYTTDLDIVWETVSRDLPVLVPAVRRLRDELLAEEPPPPEPA